MTNCVNGILSNGITLAVFGALAATVLLLVCCALGERCRFCPERERRNAPLESRTEETAGTERETALMLAQRAA